MLNRSKKKKSFKLSILQAFGLLTTVIVFAVSLSYYNKIILVIFSLSDNIIREVTEKIIERTTNYLNVPASQTKIISRLVKEKNILENHEEIWKYMWEQLMILPQVQAIFIADEDGNYVQVRREPDYATRIIEQQNDPPTEKWCYRDENYNILKTEIKLSNFDPRKRPWYINTKKEPKIYWTDVYIFTTARTPGISATYPVSDKNGNKRAVACVNSPLHSLSQFIAGQKVSENGLVFVVNEKDEIMAYPDTNLITDLDTQTKELKLRLVYDLDKKYIVDAYETYKKTKQNKFISISEGKKYFTTVVPFPKDFVSKWQIVVIIPASDLLSSVHKMVIQAIGVAFFIFLASMFIIYLITDRITKSIYKLALGTEKIRDFKLDEFKGVESNIKEIDIMSRALISVVQGLNSFKKYVPAELVRQLIQLEKLAKLGGHESELTIFFSDIEGFATIGEKLTPKELMEHLSDYLDELSKIIMKNHGTIDKYIGDSIMAFWGAPVKLPDSPYLACLTALECKKTVEKLNIRWREENKPELKTRIGIHTGKTIVGNLGTKERLNYTIIGDSVNLASRLEGINKVYGIDIIISEFTYRQVSEKFFCRPLDVVAVKGKSVGVKIYELVAKSDEEITKAEKKYYKKFSKAFDLYLNKDWDNALKIFISLQKKFSEDKAVSLFINRCYHFKKNPALLPKQWDGTFVINEK